VSEIDFLREVVIKFYGHPATHVETVPVNQLFEGKTARQVNVEVFDLDGHMKATQCFAWIYQDNDGRTRYTAVLKMSPVETPQDAVKAALVAQAEKKARDA
jgi:hypothetical protein